MLLTHLVRRLFARVVVADRVLRVLKLRVSGLAYAESKIASNTERPWGGGKRQRAGVRKGHYTYFAVTFDADDLAGAVRDLVRRTCS